MSKDPQVPAGTDATVDNPPAGLAPLAEGELNEVAGGNAFLKIDDRLACTACTSGGSLDVLKFKAVIDLRVDPADIGPIGR